MPVPVHKNNMRSRKQNRLAGYDYSSTGGYFVTISISNRLENRNMFGDVISGEMKLNEYGMIADRCWKNIPGYADNAEIDEYAIMPDHIHGIVCIMPFAGNDQIFTGNRQPYTGNRQPYTGNRHACSLQINELQYKKLPVIIGSYKSAVSKLIHQSGNINFNWQKSYHDRIIRDNDELNRIRKYIRENPARWEIDRHTTCDGYM